VLIDGGRLIAELGERGTDQSAHHVASAVSAIVARFVEHNDEQTVLLEDGVLYEGIYVVFEPVVGGAKSAIVRVVAAVRRDERVVGKVSAGKDPGPSA